jgi:hypothetical protein
MNHTNSKTDSEKLLSNDLSRISKKINSTSLSNDYFKPHEENTNKYFL